MSVGKSIKGLDLYFSLFITTCVGAVTAAGQPDRPVMVNVGRLVVRLVVVELTVVVDLPRILGLRSIRLSGQ